MDEFHKTEEEYRLHNDDAFIHPALTALQIALGDLWRSWGLEPSAVVGLSQGEIAAAHFARALTLGDAMKIVCGISKVSRKKLNLGKMVVVNLDRRQTEEAIRGYEHSVALAAEFSPTLSVLSGEANAIQQIIELLGERGIGVHWVKIGLAYHSSHVEQLRHEFVGPLRGLDARPPGLPFYSSVTGSLYEGADFGPDYWWKILRNPSLFVSVIKKLVEDGFDKYLEIGPHPILLGSIRETYGLFDKEPTLLSSMSRDEDEYEVMLKARDTLREVGVGE